MKTRVGTTGCKYGNAIHNGFMLIYICLWKCLQAGGRGGGGRGGKGDTSKALVSAFDFGEVSY